MPATHSILEFYQHGQRNTDGDTLNDVLSWTDESLEDNHRFIQWLFPTFAASAFNPQAPVLTDDVVREFLRDEQLRDRLTLAFDRMLSFYGLTRSGVNVVKAANWPERSSQWLVFGDHNHLRLTRILDSLSTLGFKHEAAALLACLEDIAGSDEGRREIDPRSLTLWRRAVKTES